MVTPLECLRRSLLGNVANSSTYGFGSFDSLLSCLSSITLLLHITFSFAVSEHMAKNFDNASLVAVVKLFLSRYRYECGSCLGLIEYTVVLMETIAFLRLITFSACVKYIYDISQYWPPELYSSRSSVSPHSANLSGNFSILPSRRLTALTRISVIKIVLDVHLPC